MREVAPLATTSPISRRFNMMRAYCLLATTLLAVACAPTSRLDLGPAAGAGPVVCGSDCAVSWQRAQHWIAVHSRMQVQTSTDVLVSTESPVRSPTFGFTVTKEPLQNGQHRIVLVATCVDWIQECSPKKDEVAAAFNHFVATGVDVIAAGGKTFRSIR